MAIGLYAAMATVGAVICIEALSGQWLRRQLMVLAPALRPDPRHMEVREGLVTFMHPYLLNRNIAMLTLFLWPTLLCAMGLASQRRQRQWLLAGLAPACAAILAAHHATSKIALIGSGVAFGALLLAPAASPSGRSAWGWVGTVVLVVPLATLAFQNELHLRRGCRARAKHRIVIWGHTSQLIAKAPILGAGIHTARALHDPNDYDAPRARARSSARHRPAQLITATCRPGTRRAPWAAALLLASVSGAQVVGSCAAGRSPISSAASLPAP
jgi:hypothetical protein